MLVDATPETAARAFDEARRAWETVAFYKRRGPAPTSFEATPLLWKREVQASLPKAWFPDGLDARAFCREVIAAVRGRGRRGRVRMRSTNKGGSELTARSKAWRASSDLPSIAQAVPRARCSSASPGSSSTATAKSSRAFSNWSSMR